MYSLDRDRRMPLVIAIEKDPPVLLFKTLLQYHLDAGFNFTGITNDEESKSDQPSFLEELFDRSKNLKRDV